MNKCYRVLSGFAVSLLLALGSMQASAGSLYEFGFAASGSFSGSVSGTIYGLVPGGSTPSSILLTSGPGVGSGGVVFTPSALVFDSDGFLVDGFSASFSLVAGEILSAGVFGFSDDGLSFLEICADFADICDSSAFAYVDRETNDGIISGKSENVVFAEVPLPATSLLFLFGLVAVGCRNRATPSHFVIGSAG